MIVTTHIAGSAISIQQAQQLCATYGLPYIKRQKLTVKQLTARYGELLIVYDNGLRYIAPDGAPLFFHPSGAMVRMKNGHDPLLALVGSEPQHVLDTTLGLGSDSIILSAGGHRVTAIETDPIIHLIVSEGLRTYDAGHEVLNAAMRRIETVHADNHAYLLQQAANSVDVVYADPMFSQTIVASQQLDGLRQRACYDSITPEWFSEACRVARRQVIIKAHYQDTVFERFGMTRLVRKQAKFHYGYFIV